MQRAGFPKRRTEMLIWWGRKATKKTLGRVADFCPLCRALAPFTVVEHGTVGHVYSIPLGSRELVGHTRTCNACKVDLNAQPRRYAMIFERVMPKTFDELLTRS